MIILRRSEESTMADKKSIVPRNYVSLALTKRMTSGAAGVHDKSNKANRRKFNQTLSETIEIQMDDHVNEFDNCTGCPYCLPDYDEEEIYEIDRHNNYYGEK